MEVVTTQSTDSLHKVKQEDAIPASPAANSCLVSAGSFPSVRSVGTWARATTAFKSTQTYALCCSGDEEEGLVDRFECTICGDAFSSEGYLEKHQKARHSQKGGKYQCQFCDYSTDFLSTIKRHERMHSGEKPHVCEICRMGFAVKCNLDRHLKTIHEQERSYKCATCGHTFKHKTHLQKHEKTHGSERPYACKECGKTFTQKAHLSDHVRLHTGNKPFSCTHCGKSFAVHSNLKSHVVSMHTNGSQLSSRKRAKRTR